MKGLFLCFTLILALTFPGIIAGAEKSVTAAQKKPATVAELALYRGADRQRILEEGAKKEGKLIMYMKGTGTGGEPVVEAFQKRYPYVKVEVWKAGSTELVGRLSEEYRAGKYAVDAIVLTTPDARLLRKTGILQPFYSPELANIEEDANLKAPSDGVFTACDYQSFTVLGYNTKLISKGDLPKTYQDLLDPKWKGKLPIAGRGAGEMWMSSALFAFGEEFVRRLAKQEFIAHMVSGRAVLDMIINGEYPFSPSAINSHVEVSKRKGAPIDYIFIEPVATSDTTISIASHAIHPHAALLYIDFDLSREVAEKFYNPLGYYIPRKDFPDRRTFKKFNGWQTDAETLKSYELFSTLFLRK